MCLAVPGKILSIEDKKAVVDINGMQTRADLSLLPDAKVGDYVIVHTGFAIQKYNDKEAEETLQAIREALGEA